MYNFDDMKFSSCAKTLSDLINKDR